MAYFRKATMDDIPELVRLRINFLSEMNDHKAPEGFEESLKRYFEVSISDGSFTAWVAEEDGNIVATSGMCFYRITPGYSNITGKIAYIQNMYTLPTYRRRGLASELLGRIIEEAREKGYKKLILHATADGRKVYEKFGFVMQDSEMVRKLET